MQKEPLENVSKMPFFNMMQEKLIELLDLNLPLGDELSAIFYILGIVTFENSGPEKCTSFFFRVQKSMFVHTSCTLLFFAQQNCEYTRVDAVRVFYSSDYEYTQLTRHRLEVKYILNNLLL